MRALPACVLAAALATGGAIAQTATPRPGSTGMGTGTSTATGTSTGASGATGAPVGAEASVPSRPAAPSAPTTGTTPVSENVGRSSREIGGMGSAGLGAMGGSPMSSSSIFNGAPDVLATPRRSATPAPTMHDSTRDHCPPGQVMRDQGCVRARTY